VSAHLGGLDALLGNIRARNQRQSAAVGQAAFEIAQMLESYAKTHTGKTPREGGWIRPPGMIARKRNAVPSATAPGGYVYPAGEARRWREGGLGWGDVTGHLRKSIRARVRAGGRHRVDIILSANTPYAPVLELGKGGRWKWLADAVKDNRRRIVDIVQRRLRA